MSMYEPDYFDRDDDYDDYSDSNEAFLSTIDDAHLLNCFNKFGETKYLNEMVLRLFKEKMDRAIIDDFEDLT